MRYRPPKFTIFFRILRNYDKPPWYVCRLLTQKRQYVEESELQIWNQGSQILMSLEYQADLFIDKKVIRI